jgi:hypothetical protein
LRLPLLVAAAPGETVYLATPAVAASLAGVDRSVLALAVPGGLWARAATHRYGLLEIASAPDIRPQPVRPPGTGGPARACRSTVRPGLSQPTVLRAGAAFFQPTGARPLAGTK